MSTLHLLDPEIHPLLELMPSLSFSAEILPMIREQIADTIQMGDAEEMNVIREEILVPGLKGEPQVRCLKYTPVNVSKNCAAYLHIHGGGYVVGLPEQSDLLNLKMAAELGIMVVSVDYRLAPEHSIPAPLDDCYAVLAWLHQNSDELGIDPARIAIGGESAGGGLAAALALRARDAGEFPICFQALVYPMLDDRTGSDDMPGDPVTGEFVWTRTSNQFGWASYLGHADRAAPQVPARALSLKGLPPAWIATATLDLFREEDVAYAQRLMADGVVTELVVYPATCHGFQLVAEATISKRFYRDHLSAIARGLSISKDTTV